MRFTQLVLQGLIIVSIVGLMGETAWYFSSEKAHLQRILPLHNNHILSAFFSPDDKITQLIIELINSEEISIKIAAYLLTDARITEALLEAAQRGISIEFIGDMKDSSSSYGKIGLLHNAGIPLWIYPHTNKGIMHNKFMIFKKNLYGRSILCTGSYNYTWSASTKNQENILILDDEDTIKTYETHYEKLKARCKRIPLTYDFLFFDRNEEIAPSKSCGNGAEKI